MAGARKLQAEVDRTLKQIGEHIVEFDGIWDKAVSAPTPNLKEKYETDLKKEIKKLQRLRDAAKVFIQHHDIKNKKPLIDARKTIETKMEQFKVLERETKTKAYSKEGLSLNAHNRKARGDASSNGGVISEKDEERKSEIKEWLDEYINSLQTQYQEYEEKIEAAKGGSSTATTTKGKKKGKSSSSSSADNVEELQHTLDRHQWHIDRLTGIGEKLDDDILNADQVEGIKDDIEYYINNHQEPDFQEDESIYDELDLDAEGSMIDTDEADNTKDDNDEDNEDNVSIDVDETEEAEEEEKDKRGKPTSPHKSAAKPTTTTATKPATTTTPSTTTNVTKPPATAAAPAATTKATAATPAASKSVSAVTPTPAAGPPSTAAPTMRISPSTSTTTPAAAARTQTPAPPSTTTKPSTGPSPVVIPTPIPAAVTTKKNLAPSVTPATPAVPTPVTVIPTVKPMESMASIVMKGTGKTDEQRRTSGPSAPTPATATPVTNVTAPTTTAIAAKPPLPVSSSNLPSTKPAPITVNPAAPSISATIKPESSPSAVSSAASLVSQAPGRPPLIAPIKLPSSAAAPGSSTATTPTASPTTTSTASAPSTPLLSAASQLGSASVSAATSHGSVTGALTPASSPPVAPTSAPLSRPSSAASLNQPDDATGAFLHHHAPSQQAPQPQQQPPHTSVPTSVQPAPGFSPNINSLMSAAPPTLSFDHPQPHNTHPHVLSQQHQPPATHIHPHQPSHLPMGPQQQQLQHPSSGSISTISHLQPPPSSSAVGKDRDRGLIPDDYFYTLSLLDTSIKSFPHADDTDRPKQYTPRNPHRTPPYFPTMPAPIFDDPALFEKLSMDTLFFIFYFQQGTPHQYLAARELKKQSWRYHKNFLTWFQRHDDPKLTSEEYEQGTYVYFDYESGWCQRIKTDFTFEYRHLEDELNVPLASTL